MNIRYGPSAVLFLIILVPGCRAGAVTDSAPYESNSGLSFEIDDGTGIFYSATKSYKPVYCGTEYPTIRMDIGQERFRAIEELVTKGNIWTATIETVSNCQIIDVALPEQYYKFEARDRSIVLRVGQCQGVDPAHEHYLASIRKLVRDASDRHSLRVKGECVSY